MSDANGAIKAYDCDSHVEESEVTWSEKYWDPAFRDRRPVLIETDELGNLSFIIDSLSHPRITGPGVALSGGPVSKDGRVSPAWQRIIAAAAEKGHTDTIESAELRSGRARLEQMDREDVAVEVNFPSVLLTWPIANDPKIGCAVARAYNDCIADMSNDDPTRLKPESTDGGCEDSGRGWVRELQGRWPGVGVDGRPADGLQSPHRAPKALCGSALCGGRRGYAAGDSRDRGGARLRGR